MQVGKVLGDDGFGSSEGIFEGVKWAYDQGAHVISMSLGVDFPGFISFQCCMKGLLSLMKQLIFLRKQHKSPSWQGAGPFE
jgi:subtilisin family serine protease